MISLEPYINHGLADLLTHVDINGSASRPGDSFQCDSLEVADLAGAQQDVTVFHRRRWPGRTGLDPTDRMADLAEILVGLYLVETDHYVARDVFPRCLSSAGRRVSQAGIDLTAFRLEPLTTEPLDPRETLHVAEAKHTTSRDVNVAINSLQDDVGKTDSERLADELQLLISYVEDNGLHVYPERVHRFMQEGACMVLSVLLDPQHTSADTMCRRATNRFSNATTPSAIPVQRLLISKIDGLQAWIAPTL